MQSALINVINCTSIRSIRQILSKQPCFVVELRQLWKNDITLTSRGMLIILALCPKFSTKHDHRRQSLLHILCRRKLKKSKLLTMPELKLYFNSFSLFLLHMFVPLFMIYISPNGKIHKYPWNIDDRISWHKLSKTLKLLSSYYVILVKSVAEDLHFV